MRPRELLVAALLLVSAPAWAAFTIVGEPKLAFTVTGIMNIDGTMTGGTLVDDGTNLVFTVPVSTVDTGIMPIRDGHIRDRFVVVSEYPNVVLTLPKGSVSWPTEVGKATKGSVTASFMVRAAHDVSVTYKIKKLETGFQVDAEFPFDVKQHGITYPMSYEGLGFEDVVRAKVSMELTDAP